MTTLAQGISNLVAQFVRMVLKILALHLQNRAKPSLDNVAVKEPKTIYNYEEMAMGIR